jgi:23S rRNA (adenine2030-N6)-methyltransferase
MNYRHSFHAGNFADLVKHALVLWLLRARQAKGPVTVFDTHAGAGLYDLTGDGARSKEAEAGVLRLMAADGLPETIADLAAEVRAVNGGASETRLYPGSPLLVARALRKGDAYRGFELNPPVTDLLVQALADHPYADGRPGDGYVETLAGMKSGGGSAPLALIDPPFERPDDYLRAAETAMAVVRADPKATVAVWTPLKDMETFDGFLRRLSGEVLVAEARLRPLTNPMKMNGCAMVVLNPPAGADQAAQEICDWVAGTLGEAGARAEVWRL